MGGRQSRTGLWLGRGVSELSVAGISLANKTDKGRRPNVHFGAKLICGILDGRGAVERDDVRGLFLMPE